MTVTSTRDSVLSTEAGRPTPRPSSQSVSTSAKASPAKAAPRKPDRVMAIWMVERKPEGSSTSFSSLGADLSPSSAIIRSFPAFREMTAISVMAKKALMRIRTACTSSCWGILSKKILSFKIR